LTDGETVLDDTTVVNNRDSVSLEYAASAENPLYATFSTPEQECTRI